jgi:hypothetical protein
VAERRAATADLREKLNALTTSSNAGPLARPAERLTNLLARFARGPGRAQGAYSDLENALLSSFPGRLDALREAMKAGSVSQEDLPDDVRTRYVTADGRARVEVFPAERLTDHEALRHFVTSVRSVAPNATDAPVILLAGGDTVITAFKQAGLLALVMVSGLLIAVLRNSGDLILVLCAALPRNGRCDRAVAHQHAARGRVQCADHYGFLRQLDGLEPSRYRQHGRAPCRLVGPGAHLHARRASRPPDLSSEPVGVADGQPLPSLPGARPTRVGGIVKPTRLRCAALCRRRAG